MVTSDLRSRLVEVLGSIAAYNDKGFQWSGHSVEEVRLHQEQSQDRILELVAEIGEEAFSPELWVKLKSGEASRDGSGDVYFQAKAELC